MAAFVAVAELRGFAAAARRLGLPPPKVTRLVAALEARLAIRLLHRTTRAVALTDAGARYLARARRILGEVADAEANARAERLAPSGRLVVAAPRVFGRLEVAPLLCEFLRLHPAVTGELHLNDHLTHLIDDGIDVALRIGQLDDSTLTARRVGATRRVLVAAPAYLAAHRRLRRPADLAAHATIQFTALTPHREWRFVARGRDLRVPIAPRLVTNSAEAAIGHAERGGGVAMVLAYQVAEAVAAGRLQIVLPGFEPPPAPIHLVYPSARLLSANVKAFVELALATRRWQFVDL